MLLFFFILGFVLFVAALASKNIIVSLIGLGSLFIVGLIAANNFVWFIIILVIIVASIMSVPYK